MSRYISLAALWLAATPAHAGEFSAFEAESISLGSIHGVVYYTVQPDGYRVITTVAEGEDGLPLRFELMTFGLEPHASATRERTRGCFEDSKPAAWQTARSDL